MLGLLNTMAHALGSTTRFIPLQTGDQTSVVLRGDEGAIRTALAEGLLPIDVPGAAAEQGKAFEEQVIQRMLQDDAL